MVTELVGGGFGRMGGTGGGFELWALGDHMKGLKGWPDFSCVYGHGKE